METYYLAAPVLLTPFILLIPQGYRFVYMVLLTLFTAIITSLPAIGVLMAPGMEPFTGSLVLFPGMTGIAVDPLSAFFILVTNMVMVCGTVYSGGYLAPYLLTESKEKLSLHYFSLSWLHLSMIAVLMFREGTAFLVAWELMALSSFLLVLFDSGQRETLKISVSYLVQMHVGLLFLLAGFLLAERETGIFGFDALPVYFTDHPNAPLFFLLFAGFAMKAGFVPFHTWLPDAHPAAPSHVSGIMSGVMIKMGIYGIIRVTCFLQNDLVLIGAIVLAIATFTMLFGIMFSVVQDDLKRLLAYSTIENAGIIGIGAGIGIIGLGSGNPTMVMLGFTGALLHVVNHSLFKPLLFFGAGAVYTATHTRSLGRLGGLIRKIPVTGGLLLAGITGISALPPLNGFISEILLYFGLFSGLQSGLVFLTLLMLLVIIALSVTGGLAIMGFTKAFGIGFLGSPRAEIEVHAEKITPGMLLPQFFLVAIMVSIGMFPMVFISPVLGITSNLFGTTAGTTSLPLLDALGKISLVLVVMTAITGAILLIRWYLCRKREVRRVPVWGCGYTAPSPRQQYTGESWSAGFGELTGGVLMPKTAYEEIAPEELFPRDRRMVLHRRDPFASLSGWITGWSMLALKKIARLQTGNIQHYILYAFLFMMVLFSLLYLEMV